MDQWQIEMFFESSRGGRWIMPFYMEPEQWVERRVPPMTLDQLLACVRDHLRDAVMPDDRIAGLTFVARRSPESLRFRNIETGEILPCVGFF